MKGQVIAKCPVSQRRPSVSKLKLRPNLLYIDTDYMWPCPNTGTLILAFVYIELFFPIFFFFLSLPVFYLCYPHCFPFSFFAQVSWVLKIPLEPFVCLYGEVCDLLLCVLACGAMAAAEARSVDVALVGASGDMASLCITAPWSLLDWGAWHSYPASFPFPQL